MKKINKKDWNYEGKKLVIEILIRSASNYGWGGDPKTQSIIGKIAAERLMELAIKEDENIVKEILKEREVCLEGCSRILNDLFGD
jgi:hypothetical protein